ncbi:MAG: creatininase family protein [Chloroflexi bacterium]|nr:creatininase family protein [Chloroflexota bacterium]
MQNDLREIRLESLTRREFREALQAGHYRVAIIAIGSIEQHLEHLALVQDIASSTYLAERVAERVSPNVVVVAPVSIGIAEHHMKFAGTLSAKPGSWLAVMFDVVESLVRHGVKRVLLLNGHAGNVAPMQSAMPQWKLYFEKEHPEVDLRFHSYWDLLPAEFVTEVLDTGRFPGHATEFETSFTMHALPENVRIKAMPYSESPDVGAATAEKGRLIVEKTLDEITKVVEEMLAGA